MLHSASMFSLRINHDDDDGPDCEGDDCDGVDHKEDYENQHGPMLHSVSMFSLTINKDDGGDED